MVLTGTPNAPAWLISKSRLYCAVSSKPLGRTPVKRESCETFFKNSSRALISASCPKPARSCSSTSKPAELPKPRTAGGAIATTRASRILLNLPIALAATACAVLSGDFRSDQSTKRTNARATFCPFPAEPIPETANRLLNTSFSFSRKYCSTCLITCKVRSWVAPGGN